MTVDESPAPTVPAHAPARPAMTTSELADNLSKISTEDVSGSIPQRPDDNRSGALQSARAESSPEPDIPLSARTKQGATGRSSTSAPATPVPDQSVPPSRDEPPPHPQKFLAPNIQKTIEPMPLHDALRAVVMLRLQCDRQTQEERVTPILLDNLSKTEPPMPSVATPEDVIREVTTGERKKAREEVFGGTRESLQVRFAKRQEDLAVKVAHLREEYLGLHKQWLVHCNKLDDVAKAIALQEAAATAGRTTRRSLATMGDAVRSDLEMEQIIASLGNEEMTDANHLGAKNAAVIPDMISVTRGAVDYLFDDTNNEVEDPATYYAPTTGIDDWTEDEVTVFLDKFAETPKQFGIIADALPNKTPAQCVTFYYLHKNKHIDFRQVVARRAQKRKRGGRKQKSNALLADIRKRDDEVSAAAPARRRRAPAGSSSTAEPRRGSGRRGAAAVQAEDTPDGTPTPEPDNEPRKRRRRVAARATVAEQEEGAEDAVSVITIPLYLNAEILFCCRRQSRNLRNVLGNHAGRRIRPGLPLPRHPLPRPLWRHRHSQICQRWIQWIALLRLRSSQTKPVRRCRGNLLGQIVVGLSTTRVRPVNYLVYDRPNIRRRSLPSAACSTRRRFQENCGFDAQ